MFGDSCEPHTANPMDGEEAKIDGSSSRWRRNNIQSCRRRLRQKAEETVDSQCC